MYRLTKIKLGRVNQKISLHVRCSSILSGCYSIRFMSKAFQYQPERIVTNYLTLVNVSDLFGLNLIKYKQVNYEMYLGFMLNLHFSVSFLRSDLHKINLKVCDDKNETD